MRQEEQRQQQRVRVEKKRQLQSGRESRQPESVKAEWTGAVQRHRWLERIRPHHDWHWRLVLVVRCRSRIHHGRLPLHRDHHDHRLLCRHLGCLLRDHYRHRDLAAIAGHRHLAHHDAAAAGGGEAGRRVLRHHDLRGREQPMRQRRRPEAHSSHEWFHHRDHRAHCLDHVRHDYHVRCCCRRADHLLLVKHRLLSRRLAGGAEHEEYALIVVAVAAAAAAAQGTHWERPGWVQRQQPVVGLSEAMHPSLVQRIPAEYAAKPSHCIRPMEYEPPQPSSVLV